jgi:predicted CxxxxCH...CXXCH cytochrome family protein
MAEPTSFYARARHSLPALLAFSAALAALVGGCLDRRTQSKRDALGDNCSSCHGDPSRKGDALLRAAPPRDLRGASTSAYPGVGAHALHLNASATHGAIACTECHIVPEAVSSPGHADDAAPAELHFGSLATAHEHEPSYDPIARRCSDSYCHGPADAVWTEPRDAAAACGSCHGLPPPAPHPQSTRCAVCHGEVVDAQNRFLSPEKHVNGQVESASPSCSGCHGKGDQPAPPVDTQGNVAVSHIGVGAHAVHLQGGSARPLACAECHLVPDKAEDPLHADGLPAEVELTGVATTRQHAPAWEHTSATCVDSWCHGPGAADPSTSPRWTEPAALGCAGCHGAPPPAPHPQLSQCSLCHGEVVGDDRRVIDPERHVDGVVDVTLEARCTGCHGALNPAPPKDLSGNDSASERGVGAHQTHLLGTPRSRAVPCAECHEVPSEVLTPGHVDTTGPAELLFSGAAVAFGASPRYANGGCSDTSCHGAVFPGGHASGGTLTTPQWTSVDGSQAACGSCHALPPPRPHPYYADDCGRCHEDAAADGKSFRHPELHVDGIVTFSVAP